MDKCESNRSVGGIAPTVVHNQIFWLDIMMVYGSLTDDAGDIVKNTVYALRVMVFLSMGCAVGTNFHDQYYQIVSLTKANFRKFRIAPEILGIILVLQKIQGNSESTYKQFCTSTMVWMIGRHFMLDTGCWIASPPPFGEYLGAWVYIPGPLSQAVAVYLWEEQLLVFR